MIVIIRTMLAGMCREIHTLIWTVVFPVGLMLGLGFYLGESGYSERLLAGVLTTNVLFGSTIITAFYVMAHRNRGIYKLLRVTPFSTSVFITSVTIARTVLSAIVSCVVIVIGVVVFDIKLHGIGLLLMLLTLMIGTLCFTAIGFIAANLSKDESNVNMISNLISFPMLFSSEAFYSLQNAPPWIKMISQMHPFYYFVEAMYASVQFTAEASIMDVLFTLVILAGFSILFLAMAKWTFRWDPDAPILMRLKRQ